jgi:alkanesulfonate monooxygenase SsuD/methylene tetrahydromethanopterin reductase-like flavin-dependent oxidoreductase (luciferase family)
MKISQEQIDNWFTFHSPTPEQLTQYKAIRDNAGTLASIIVEACPECADTTAAIRKLREVVMTANAAIACGGK